MMLGIAASISIAVPSGRRSHTGESSVRKIEMPKLTGIAMASAMKEVTSVPKIGTSAPNSSLTGSHSALHRNSKPNLRIDGMLPMRSDTRIAARRLNTRNAKNRVVFRNIASISAFFRGTKGFGAWSVTAGEMSLAAIVARSSTALMRGSRCFRIPRDEGQPQDCPSSSWWSGQPTSIDRLAAAMFDVRFPRGLDLLHDTVRKRHVVEAGGELVAFGAVGPVEELEHFLRDL